MKQERKALLAAAAILSMALVLLTCFALWLLPDPVEPPKYTVPVHTSPPSPTLVPNPYTAEDFVLEDGFMACLGAEAVTGVDVSHHQGAIDWQQVKDAGISFAIIRLGYRGYSSGQLHVDESALENLRGAAKVGLSVGAYVFSQAVTPEEAREEAQLALEILDGFPLALPVAFDWEFVSDTARTANMDSQTLGECALTFCQTVEDAGYQAMVYFNPALGNKLLDLLPLQEAGYPFWLAYYTETMDYPHRVEIWQYSCTGTVSGIQGKVDLNLMFQ